MMDTTFTAVQQLATDLCTCTHTTLGSSADFVALPTTETMERTPDLKSKHTQVTCAPAQPANGDPLASHPPRLPSTPTDTSPMAHRDAIPAARDPAASHTTPTLSANRRKVTRLFAIASGGPQGNPLPHPSVSFIREPEKLRRQVDSDQLVRFPKGCERTGS